MLTTAQLRDDNQRIIDGLLKKGFTDAPIVIAHVLTTDDKRKALQAQRDTLQAEVGTSSASIAQLMKSGNSAEAETAKTRVAVLKAEIKGLETQLEALETKIYESLVRLPNVPHSSVPAGKLPEDNEVILTWGTPPTLHDKAQPHWDLIKQYDIIDFELGNKVSGAGFPFYKGKGARLQRALINFFLDRAGAAGYREIQVPILINRDSGFGTGQLPDKDGQMYHATEDDLFLIPTAEVPLTNMYRDELLRPADLPIKVAGYTPCFRREAGSWGAHVRGLNRLHQFDKIEIVQVRKPEESYAALEEMSLHVQSLLQDLGLHYRVLRLCGGDMSFASALTYDMEVWSGAQQRWLEVSSVSNFETFQSSRLKLRYKAEGDKKTTLLHTLNGSALALPRIVASILENNQTPEGILIPEVLVPYTGFDLIG